jgi:tryptophan synthase alpha chain
VISTTVTATTVTATLEEHLRGRRASGRPLLVPYVTAGVTPDWTDVVRAYDAAGADAVEIGLPFSDPMLDGPTIQEASHRALAAGTTVDGALAALATLRVQAPLVAMTYRNLVERRGPAGFCAALREGGLRGLIVPDAPLDEAEELREAASEAAVDLVLLAAPSSPRARLREIAERSRGFVYGVTVMGVTGAREEITATATRLADDLRAVTDRPVLLGFGISTPAQATTLARHADGVVIASALMRRLLDGATPTDLGEDVAALRHALDTVETSPGLPDERRHAHAVPHTRRGGRLW